MTGQDTPFEAGLNQFVCLDKGDFIGREALLKQKEVGISRSLVCMTIDEGQIVPHGWEPILHKDQILGYVSSGEYGHCVQKSILMAYLPTDYSKTGTKLEVEILGERVPASIPLSMINLVNRVQSLRCLTPNVLRRSRSHPSVCLILHLFHPTCLRGGSLLQFITIIHAGRLSVRASLQPL